MNKDPCFGAGWKVDRYAHQHEV